MKKVNFLGTNFEVPDWANFITQNNDNGAICIWEKVPKMIGTSFYPNDWADPGEHECIGHLPTKPQVMAI